MDNPAKKEPPVRLKSCRYVKLPTQRSLRLLKIEKNVPAIGISLHIFDIGFYPAHTTLPYTWGHPVDEEHLANDEEKVRHRFQNQKRYGKLNVTPNLHDALLQLPGSGYSGTSGLMPFASNSQARKREITKST